VNVVRLVITRQCITFMNPSPIPISISHVLKDILPMLLLKSFLL